MMENQKKRSRLTLKSFKEKKNKKKIEFMFPSRIEPWAKPSYIYQGRIQEKMWPVSKRVIAEGASRLGGSENFENLAL